MLTRIKKQTNTGRTHFKKGCVPHNAGTARKMICQNCKKEFHNTKKTSRFCSKLCRGEVMRDEKHCNWKENDFGYLALHTWIQRRLGKPNYCVFCRTTTATRFEWASVSREYKRDVNDFIRLCAACHRIIDRKKIELIVQTV